MNKTKFVNENITHTIMSDDMFSGISFATVQPDYSLSAADYMRLKSGRTTAMGWSLNFAWVMLGYALSIIPKYFSVGGQNMVSAAEWIALAGGVLIVVVLWVAGLFMPSERKSLLKEIKQHFDDSPKSRQPIRGRL